MAKNFQDALDTIDIPASGTGRKMIRLTPAHFGRLIRFRLSATFTLPAAPAVEPDGLARFLTFRLFNGSDTPIVLDGDALLQFQQNVFHADDDYTEVPAVVGAQTGTWNGAIWLADPSLVYPDLVAPDLRLFTNPRLVVEFNGPASVCPTAGAVFTSGTMEFESELIEVGADLELSQLTPWRRLKQYVIDDLKANTSDQRRLLEGGYLTSKLFVIVESNPAAPTAKARSNTLVTNVELLVNGIRRGKQNFRSLQAALRQSGGANYPPKTGTGLIDFDPHKQLDKGTLLDLRGARAFEMAFGTAAALPSGLRVIVVQEDITEPDYAALARAARKNAVMSKMGK